MIVDVDFQIISGQGWMELRGNTVQIRNNGEVQSIEVPQARLHIHDNGVNISLPPLLLDHLLNCIHYHFTHDPQGKPLPKAVAQPLRVVIRS